MSLNLYRTDFWCKNALGQAVAGAQIFICSQPTDAAFFPPVPLAPNVYADPAGVIPIIGAIPSDGFGHGYWYAPAGIYTVVVANGGIIQQVYPDQSVGNVGSTGQPAGLVNSVFGRSGTVAAQTGDYSFPQISGTLGFSQAPPGGTSSTFWRGDGVWATPAGGGAVTSVFGRTGAVAATSGDYGVAQITGAAPTASPTFTGTATIAGAYITGTLADGTNAVGTSGQILTSTGTGTLWTTPSSGNNLPLLSSFSWVNQGTNGSALQRVANGPIMQTITDNASLNWRILAANAPSTPYKVQMQVKVFSSDYANSQAAGLYFYDGTKLSGLELLLQSGGAKFRVEHVTNVTTDGSTAYAESTAYAIVASELNVAGVVYLSPISYIWYQVRNSGTTLFYDVSFDGANFINLFSESVGTFITPTEVGFGGLSVVNSATEQVVLDVLSWNVVGNANL